VYNLPRSEVSNSGRTLYLASASRHQLERIIDTLHRCVPLGSQVFMGAQDMSRPGFALTELYFLLPEYRSNFHYLELPPGAAARAGSPLMADVLSADALVLNWTSPEALDRVFPYIRPGDTGVNDAVRDSFRVIETLGTARIYSR